VLFTGTSLWCSRARNKSNFLSFVQINGISEGLKSKPPDYLVGKQFFPRIAEQIRKMSISRLKMKLKRDCEEKLGKTETYRM